MAKIVFDHPASEHFPAFNETVEARIWGLGGTDGQFFYIGSGFNFQASGNLWLEIIYSVEEAQIFYTRSFLHYLEDSSTCMSRLDEVIQQGEGNFGFGDMLPETSLILSTEKVTYIDENDETKQYTHCDLEISCDTGVVFGRSGPGSRSVNVKLKSIEPEEGQRFMRDLIHEIQLAQQGKHPDPASFPEGSSEWPLIWQLNRKAYNKISDDYQEAYFNNPLLVHAFDGWLAQLPEGGKILDAGCGHGDPVIQRLLEKGFQVTGSDFSDEMLRRASAQFPQANFLQQTTSTISEQSVYDGVCSLNSMLYLDPVDLLNSLLRVRNALKPGGLLFLYAFDEGPDWRGEPFSHHIGEWMWSWHYGMEEVANLLEEHGYFKVLETCKVQIDHEEAERIRQELEKQKLEEEEFNRKQEAEPSPFPFPFFKQPIERSAYAYVVIAQRGEIML
jgi:SAM-dependent methyltransferase